MLLSDTGRQGLSLALLCDAEPFDVHDAFSFSMQPVLRVKEQRGRLSSRKRRLWATVTTVDLAAEFVHSSLKPSWSPTSLAYASSCAFNLRTN